MNPHIVSIDPGLTCTAIAHYTPSYDSESHHILTCRPNTRGGERLYALDQFLHRHIKGADVVILEGYAYHSSRIAVQAEWGGVIRLRCQEWLVPLVVIQPTTLKRFATGKGVADKTAMVIAARDRLDYTGQDHNEADARWLLELGYHRYLPERATKLPKTHLKAMGAIDWPDLTVAQRRAS